ncbi:MAG: hypothetical protein IJE05_03245 [Clostridia bacterium]|nr:hypothetical protein [Clostridia bacterium]
MGKDLFNSINTNRHYNEELPTSDEISCIPLEEVEKLLKKCANELGIDYEPGQFKEKTEDQKIEEVKKWLKSSPNTARGFFENYVREYK